MAEYFDVDRITNNQTGDVFHLKDYSLSSAVSSPAPIVSFPEGAPYPMSLQFAIEPVQSGSGDPSPSNVRPISGFDGANVTVTGKNIAKPGAYTSGGIVPSVLENGYIKLNGTSTGVPEIHNVAEFSAKPSTNYIMTVNLISGSTESFRIRYKTYYKNVAVDSISYVWWYDPSAQNPFTLSFTTNADPIDLMEINFTYSNGKTATNAVFALMVRHAEITDATWEPYKGNVYPIIFPSAAGMVYGATVTVNPDGTGKLVVDTQYLTITGTDIDTCNEYPDYPGEYYYARSKRYTNINDLVCCDSFRTIHQALEAKIPSVYTANTRIYFYSDLYTNLTEAQAYFNAHPTNVVAKFSTQTVYTLSVPQVIALLNLNHVWADVGDIQSLSYVRDTVPEMIRQDTAGQIVSALDPVESSLAIVIDGDVAVGGLDSGKYIFLKNHSTLARGLYHTTAAIADGASITGNNTEPDDEGGLNSLLADLIVERNRLTALTRHTRLTDFSLTDLQNAVADQDLAKYGLKEGDYKTINGYDYVIAGLNVMKGTHNYTCTSNHVGLIVISHTTCKWNTSSSTAGGYKSSNLHSYLVSTVLPHAQTDLGSTHLYKHKKLLSNAVDAEGYNRFGTNTGCSSGWEWVDCYISALTEAQVYGGDHWSSSGYDTGEANTLLPVFAEYKHTDIFGNEHVWLRNVSSASQACFAYGRGGASGDAGVTGASYVAGLILYH